jgi:hypothetical protein
MGLDFFPPDSFIRWFDANDRVWKYTHLVEAEGPIFYPFRFPALAVGSEADSPTTFEDLRPSKDNKHIYQAYLGLYPALRYKLYHPYDIRQLLLDETPDDINEDLVSNLTYADSPNDSPAVSIFISEQYYPAFRPRNVGIAAVHPKIDITMVKYKVEFDADIAADVKSALLTGTLPSSVITFGGRI